MSPSSPRRRQLDKPPSPQRNLSAETPAEEERCENQRRLQQVLKVASTMSARGRRHWTEDQNLPRALKEFEGALQLLESVLGTYHVLTAKTYYWLGFLSQQKQHGTSPSYDSAQRYFVQSARIRIVLLGWKDESTQEALTAISWLLTQAKYSRSQVQDFLFKLRESIRLETLGDEQLRKRDYGQAIPLYKRAMTAFDDPSYGAIMGKLACCCLKAATSGSASSPRQAKSPKEKPSTRHTTLDEAMYWYRRALLIYATQTVHGCQHPDIKSTIGYIGDVLKECDPSGVAAIDIPKYQGQILESVQEEYAGQQHLEKGQHHKALPHFQATFQMEESVLGPSHPISRRLEELVRNVQAYLVSSSDNDSSRDEQRNQDVLKADRSWEHMSPDLAHNSNATIVEGNENGSQSSLEESEESRTHQVLEGPDAATPIVISASPNDNTPLEREPVDTTAREDMDESGNVVSIVTECPPPPDVLVNGKSDSPTSRTPSEQKWRQYSPTASSKVDENHVQDEVLLLQAKVHKLEILLMQSQDQVASTEKNCQILQTRLSSQETLVSQLQVMAKTLPVMLQKAERMVQERTKQAKEWKIQLDDTKKALEDEKGPEETAREITMTVTALGIDVLAREQWQKAQTSDIALEGQRHKVADLTAHLQLVQQKSQGKLQEGRSQQIGMLLELEERHLNVASWLDQVQLLHDDKADLVNSIRQLRQAESPRKGSDEDNSLLGQYEDALDQTEQHLEDVHAKVMELQQSQDEEESATTNLRTKYDLTFEAIKTLSQELLALQEWNTRLGTKNEKLRDEFKSLETAHLALKEENAIGVAHNAEAPTEPTGGVLNDKVALSIAVGLGGE